MEMQNMQRQLQSFMYQFTDNAEFNDSGMSDLRVRSMPSLFSPALSRPSPGYLPPDQFSFNPALSPGNNRLLRRAGSGDIGSPYIRAEIGDSGERQRNLSGRMSRPAKQESYLTKSKRKSLSPQQDGLTATKQKQTTAPSFEEDEETMLKEESAPSLQFDQYLTRKKR